MRKQHTYFAGRSAALAVALAALICVLWPVARAHAHHDPMLQASLARFLDAVYFGERHPDTIIKWPRRVKIVFGGTADAVLAKSLRDRLLDFFHNEVAPATDIVFVEAPRAALATLHVILSDDPLGELPSRYLHLFTGDTEEERRKEAHKLSLRVAKSGKAGRLHTCATKIYPRHGNIENAILVFNMKFLRSLDYCVNASFLLVSGFRQTILSTGLLSVFTTNPPIFTLIDRDMLKALHKDQRVFAGMPREQALPSLLDALLHPARED